MDKLLEDEKIILRLKPSPKVIQMWIAPVAILFLQLAVPAVPVLIAVFLSRYIKDRQVRMICIVASVAWAFPLGASFIILVAMNQMVEQQVAIYILMISEVISILVTVGISYLLIKIIYSKTEAILTDRMLIFKTGLITDVIYSVPYNRISDIRVTRGAYESIFKLRSMVIETLAGQWRYRRSSAEITIEGLEEEDINNLQKVLASKTGKKIDL